MNDYKSKYEEYSKQLNKCHCGGQVTLTGGTPGYPTFYVQCLNCYGSWSIGTYNPQEAVDVWNIQHFMNDDERRKI